MIFRFSTKLSLSIRCFPNIFFKYSKALSRNYGDIVYMKTHRKKKIINVISLGCSKNLVDTEQLLAQLKANDFDVVHDSDNPAARTVVINTCGFINDAKKESIDTILEHIRAKEKGIMDQVFVMGCLSQRYSYQLKKEIPEIDGIVGVNNLDEMVKILGGDYRKDL